MKATVVLFSMLLLSSVSANFSGYWTGIGSAQDSTGWSSECESMVVELSQTNDYLDILSSKYNCGNFSSEMNSTRVQIVGNELWYGGSRVGSITATTINAQIEDPQSQLTQNFNLSLNNGILTYEEEISFSENGNTYFLDVSGQLSK